MHSGCAPINDHAKYSKKKPLIETEVFRNLSGTHRGGCGSSRQRLNHSTIHVFQMTRKLIAWYVLLLFAIGFAIGFIDAGHIFHLLGIILRWNGRNGL